MKTKLLLIPVYAIGLTLVCCACRDENPVPQVEVHFLITDENQVEKTTFSYGDQIILNFAITNTSDERLVWYDYLPVNFFVISRVDDTEGTSPVGRPYSEFIVPAILGTKIQPRQSFFIRLSWNDSNYSTLSNWSYEPANNTPLTTGQYTTELSMTLDFHGYDKLSFNKIINFVVK